MPPKAPGLVLSANVFGNASGICELILLLFGYDQMPVQAVVKIVLGTVGNILGFTANVLGVVDVLTGPADPGPPGRVLRTTRAPIRLFDERKASCRAGRVGGSW